MSDAGYHQVFSASTQPGQLIQLMSAGYQPASARLARRIDPQNLRQLGLRDVEEIRGHQLFEVRLSHPRAASAARERCATNEFSTTIGLIINH